MTVVPHDAGIADPTKQVLIVSEYGEINGGENSLLATLPTMREMGWDFAALVPKETAFAEALVDAGVETIPFCFRDGPVRKPLADLRQQIGSCFRSLSPALIHCNSLSASRICGPVTKSIGIASVGYLRDIIKLSNQAVKDLNQIDRLVAVSNATRQWHVGQGVDPHRVQVNHNGINTIDFCRDRSPTENPIRQQLGLSPTARLVLSVGQIGIRKGLRTCLQAAEKIAEKRNGVYFIIVGQRHSQKDESIQYEKELQDLSESGNVKGRVFWLGRRRDVADLMAQSNVLLHCARQEPLGRVLLEAFSSSLPVVATDVGGTREILNRQQLNACLIPPDDANAAVASVIRLLDNQEYWQEMSQLVRQIAVQDFSVSRCSIRLGEIYLDAIATKSSKSDSRLRQN